MRLGRKRMAAAKDRVSSTHTHTHTHTCAHALNSRVCASGGSDTCGPGLPDGERGARLAAAGPTVARATVASLVTLLRETTTSCSTTGDVRGSTGELAGENNGAGTGAAWAARASSRSRWCTEDGAGEGGADRRINVSATFAVSRLPATLLIASLSSDLVDCGPEDVREVRCAMEGKRLRKKETIRAANEPC
jgi:hypothetical protein